MRKVLLHRQQEEVLRAEQQPVQMERLGFGADVTG
jgi:hypothetical protein